MTNPYLDATFLYLRILGHALSPVFGGIGIYALVCSSLHPHPDAALWAFLLLGTATGIKYACGAR